MKSLIISKGKNNFSGFTLIEIIIVLAIVVGIFAIGAFVDLSNLNRELLTTEHTILISTLQKARNRSMNNIGGISHGVHIDSDAYILFRGLVYDSASTTNETIPRNNKIAISGLNNVVFWQLSGETNNIGDITLSDETRNKKITILENGLIDW